MTTAKSTTTTMTVIMSRANAMTIDRPRRDKHPARAARILATGIALSATLGLTSAYALTAQAEPAPTDQPEPLLDPTTAAQPTAQLAPMTAPTAPAPAAPATKSAAPQAAASTLVATPSTTPPPATVAVPVQVQVPQSAWVPVQTSGSN